MSVGSKVVQRQPALGLRVPLWTAVAAGLALGTGLTGCTTAPSASTSPVERESAVVSDPKAVASGFAGAVDLPFLNSGTFDESLRAALTTNPDQVRVPLAGRIDVSAFPERLDRWLLAVQESGGRVAQRTVPPPGEPQERFVGTLVDFAVKLWSLGEQRRRYGAAAGYDAIVEVERTSGVVRSVSFHRRPAGGVR